MKRGIFITASGTDAGKTYISALIVKSLREAGVNAGYYKPVLSGAEIRGGELISGDSEYVLKKAGIKGSPAGFTGYMFKAPLSPHFASRLEGREIEAEKIAEGFEKVSRDFSYIVAEGCGGIACPLSGSLMLTDIIKMLGLKAAVAVPSGLGAINQAVVTVSYAKNLLIPVRGIIMNMYDKSDIIHRDNKETIERLTGLPVIAAVEKGAGKIDAGAFL